MARRRHTPEQIVRKLREADKLLNEGQDVAAVCRYLQVSEQTYHRWRNQYRGMKADDAKELRDLRKENQRLKRIVADKELEIDALREISARCDNGPELTANALKDWCRFTGAGTDYIDPGSPWQNPWVESYGSRMRDELLAIECFDTLLEAQVLVADWREEYNTYRPHSALGMRTPVEFADQWRQDHQLQLT